MEMTGKNFDSPLSSDELEGLRPAIAASFPSATGVLGSKLGAIIRAHLSGPSLRERFGGLRPFLAHYFPAEIMWRGRRGLDDVYDIRFAQEEFTELLGAWSRVTLEPSATLWTSVTNPTIGIQFAWSPNEDSVLQASSGFPLADGLVGIEKLTTADYQNAARLFIDSLDGLDAGIREEAIASSDTSKKFNDFVRQQGLLVKWEIFRVNHAVRTFLDRLQVAGAGPNIVSRWSELLQSSKNVARSQRLQTAAASTHRVDQQPMVRRALHSQAEPMDTRTVAIAAIDFLSMSELEALHLPLGSVMRAFASLSSRI